MKTEPTGRNITANGSARSQPAATLPPMAAGGANRPQHYRQWQQEGQIGRNISANGSGRGKSAATLPPTAAGGVNRPHRFIDLYSACQTKPNNE